MQPFRYGTSRALSLLPGTALTRFGALFFDFIIRTPP